MLKKCIICGKYFEPKKSNQQFCSHKCRYENHRIMQILRRQPVDYAIDNIVDDEITWSGVPTIIEIVGAVHILMDCGINNFNDLPEFQSRNMLSRYFHDKIRQIDAVY